MNTKILLLGVFWLVFSSMAVLSVQNDTNLTLRAACTDSYGNLCLDTSKWTVLLPNGSAIYNETSGTAVTTGISEFTVWFNTTGTWYVLVNHSGQNHTAEWNILVETYDTERVVGLSEDWEVTGGLLLYGLIVLALLYAGFSLKDEHVVLKNLLVGIGLLLIPTGFILAYNTFTGNLEVASRGVAIISGALLGIIVVYSFLYFFIKIFKMLIGYNKSFDKGDKGGGGGL